MHNLNELHFREDPCPTNVRQVRDIVMSSDFFSKDETDVAMELVEERLQKGVASGKVKGSNLLLTLA